MPTPDTGDLTEVLPPPDKLTVRDYFAAAALMGLAARGTPMSAQTAAETAYDSAEAMLAERARRPESAPEGDA